MKIRNILPNVIGFLIIGIITITMVSCGKPKYKPVKADKDPNKVVIDHAYSNEIKKNNGIIEAQVYLKNNEVNVTLKLRKV